jgi:hypothetical protein
LQEILVFDPFPPKVHYGAKFIKRFVDRLIRVDMTVKTVLGDIRRKVYADTILMRQVVNHGLQGRPVITEQTGTL